MKAKDGVRIKINNSISFLFCVCMCWLVGWQRNNRCSWRCSFGPDKNRRIYSYYEFFLLLLKLLFLLRLYVREAGGSLGNDDMKCGLDGYWLVILNLQLQFRVRFFPFFLPPLALFFLQKIFPLLLLAGLNTCTCLRKEQEDKK